MCFLKSGRQKKQQKGDSTTFTGSPVVVGDRRVLDQLLEVLLTDTLLVEDIKDEETNFIPVTMRLKITHCSEASEVHRYQCSTQGSITEQMLFSSLGKLS